MQFLDCRFWHVSWFVRWELLHVKWRTYSCEVDCARGRYTVQALYSGHTEKEILAFVKSLANFRGYFVN